MGRFDDTSEGQYESAVEIIDLW